MKFLAPIQRFLNDEEGASGIEYAMIAGMVALVLAGSSKEIRDAIKGIFGNIGSTLTTAASGT